MSGVGPADPHVAPAPGRMTCSISEMAPVTPVALTFLHLCLLEDIQEVILGLNSRDAVIHVDMAGPKRFSSKSFSVLPDGVRGAEDLAVALQAPDPGRRGAAPQTTLPHISRPPKGFSPSGRSAPNPYCPNLFT